MAVTQIRGAEIRFKCFEIKVGDRWMVGGVWMGAQGTFKCSNTLSTCNETVNNVFFIIFFSK